MLSTGFRGADENLLKVAIRRLAIVGIALLGIAAAMVAAPERAIAQVTCPSVTNVSMFGFADAGTCVVASGPTSPDNGFAIFQSSDDCKDTITTNVNNLTGPGGMGATTIRGIDNGVGERPISVDCPGCREIEVGSSGDSIEIKINVGVTTSFSVTFSVNGDTRIVRLTGTYSRPSDAECALSNVSFTIGATEQDSARITDGLLSSFLAANGSMFGPNGVPSSVTGGGQEQGNGISFVPTALQSHASRTPGDRLSRPGFTFGSTTANKGFNFSFDLNAMMRARTGAAEASAASLGIHEAGLADGASPVPPRFNVWASGRYVDFDDDSSNADRSGDLWWVMSGVSYRVNERITVGAFGRVKTGEVESRALNSALESDFFGGGAFAALNVPGGARVMLGGLYEHGDNDIVIESARGTFNTDEWSLEGRVDRRFTHGRHWIEPQVRIRYTVVERQGFTDSVGNPIPSNDLSLGRLTFGPTIGTTIARPDGTEIKPFARINGIWDFENEGDITLSTGAVFSSADTGLNLGSGVEMTFVNGTSVRVSGDWYTYEGSLEVWSVQGGVGAPLWAFGLGSPAYQGRFSFNFATTTDNQTVKAGVTLPLN